MSIGDVGQLGQSLIYISFVGFATWVIVAATYILYISSYIKHKLNHFPCKTKSANTSNTDLGTVNYSKKNKFLQRTECGVQCEIYSKEWLWQKPSKKKTC